MSKKPSFQNDQYFFMDKQPYKSALSKIEKLISSEVAADRSFERVWIPENQVQGEIHKIGYTTFQKVEAIFNKDLLPQIEKETGLSELELVAVRRNTLGLNQMVKAHSDTDGYVLMLDVLSDDQTFDGGDVLFTKDDGSIVEVSPSSDKVLVAKCTNEHGVTRVTKGERTSIALFARPKP